MARNRDTVVALCLLALCAAMFIETFNVRGFEQAAMGPEVWPRVVLAVLALLSAIYLAQSLKAGPDVEDEAEAGRPRGFFRRYRNALWCYGLFTLYVATLHILGVLIGGILLVFAILTALGYRTPRALATHALIAVVSIGGMWALFVFGLGVFLPRGIFLPHF